MMMHMEDNNKKTAESKAASREERACWRAYWRTRSRKGRSAATILTRDKSSLSLKVSASSSDTSLAAREICSRSADDIHVDTAERVPVE